RRRVEIDRGRHGPVSLRDRQSRRILERAYFVGRILGEPDVVIGSGDKELRAAAETGILRDRAAGGDLADLAAGAFSEPEIPIRTSRNPLGTAVRRGYRVLGERAAGRDLADLVRRVLGEPQIVVRARGDARWTTGTGGNTVLGDGAAGGDL